MRRRRLLFWLVSVLFTGCASQPTAPDILLFNGSGTSPNDTATLEDVLRETGKR
jgi:hypothetical protein